jgi:hypothetical protein
MVAARYPARGVPTPVSRTADPVIPTPSESAARLESWWSTASATPHDCWRCFEWLSGLAADHPFESIGVALSIIDGRLPDATVWQSPGMRVGNAFNASVSLPRIAAKVMSRIDTGI